MNKIKESPYELLEISENGDLTKLKQKYIELVRRYPPETHPEEFMKIREAFDHINKPTEAAFDAIYLYKNKIMHLFDEKQKDSSELSSDNLKDIFEVPFAVEAEIKMMIDKNKFRD